jgi:ferredoxin-nitrite reductase
LPAGEDARVTRDADGYWQLKPSEKAGNPFEKLKLARDPLKHLLHLDEVSALASKVQAAGFEAVDTDKEAETASSAAAEASPQD